MSYWLNQTNWHWQADIGRTAKMLPMTCQLKRGRNPIVFRSASESRCDNCLPSMGIIGSNSPRTKTIHITRWRCARGWTWERVMMGRRTCMYATSGSRSGPPACNWSTPQVLWRSYMIAVTEKAHHPDHSHARCEMHIYVCKFLRILFRDRACIATEYLTNEGPESLVALPPSVPSPGKF